MGNEMTVFEWLNGIYLPGYMVLSNEDYQGSKAWFDVKPVEPQVTVFSDAYLTPRGTHIIISQGAYCLFENLARQGKFPLSVEELRRIGESGRLKLTRLVQDFRREIPLSERLEGRFELTRLRNGAIPVAKVIFDLGNRAIRGELQGVIAPHSVVQTNQDILRN